MLINLSNHPSSNWTSEQLIAAQEYGKVIDLPFPNIDPFSGVEYIQSVCNDYLQEIYSICRDGACPISKLTVHIMGEMTFTFTMVNVLKRQGITCVAATTERVTTMENDVKTSTFRFVNFRKYN